MFESWKRKKKDTSALEKGAKAALAGAAMIGAVSAVEIPAAHAQTQSTHEHVQKGFDSAREAGSVIAKVGQMDIGVDDARGKLTLQKRIQAQLDIFTLTLDQQADTNSIAGFITPQSRERAYDALMSELVRAQMKDPALEKNPSLKLLGDILNQAPRAQAEPETHKQAGGGVEVRRIKNKDW